MENSTRKHSHALDDTRTCQPTISTSASRMTSPHLLLLPAELRNRICEYALTSDSVLQMQVSFVPRMARLSHSNTSVHNYHRDFNALQHVCKQLYSETVGLELKHNTIEFRADYPDKQGPSVKFLFFFSACSPARLRLLRNVRLVITTTNDPYMHRPLLYTIELLAFLRRIAGFCRFNTHVTVNYYLGLFSFNSRGSGFFFTWGAYLLMLLRDSWAVCTPWIYQVRKFCTASGLWIRSRRRKSSHMAFNLFIRQTYTTSSLSTG